MALQPSRKVGACHRDLKTANVLMNYSFEPHISDFGLSTLLSEHNTVHGDQTGTPACRLPEQWRGDADLLDGRTDICSFGVIVDALKTGCGPLRADTIRDPGDQVTRRRQVRPPRMIKDGIPIKLEHVFIESLEREAAIRYSTTANVGHGIGARETWSRGTGSRHGTMGIVAVFFAILLISISTACGIPGFSGSHQAQPDKPTADAAPATDVVSSDSHDEILKDEAALDREAPREVPHNAEGIVDRSGNGDADSVASAAYSLLEAKCYRCHGEFFNGSAQLNVLDRESLMENGYLDIGSPEDSRLYERVANGEMPPDESNVSKLTKDEQSLLLNWIRSGAPIPERESRNFITSADIVSAIHHDLQSSEPDDRRFLRYVSLAHLSNNYKRVSSLHLRLGRAAVAKVMNSLSWKSKIGHPKPLDTLDSLLRLDIRDYGWTQNDWSRLISKYPYGVHFHYSDIKHLADLDRQIDQLSGTPMCWIRADWLINTASRSPTYEQLLKLPQNASELESKLGVDVVQNFNTNRLHRAGFATSGVSQGNRMVERHDSRHGYYWKSYDFKGARKDGNLFKFPLGPTFEENDFERFAFTHDGGEIIFSLPNGLQGYFLADADGESLQRGPIEVVRDSTETAGTTEVVNAISCMHCHKNGIIDFEDTVRDGAAVFDVVKDKVKRLYPPKAKMDAIVNQDRQEFLRALEQSIGTLLRQPSDTKKDTSQFAEPIGATTRFYLRDLNISDVACELGIKDVSWLETAIRTNKELVKLGLRPLANGGTIKRAAWENNEAFVSPYQETMRILSLGTPQN